jgi:tRNA (Thr-GGU) A37 N-methylase
MTDSVLPMIHSAANPTMNQVNSGEFAMRRIRRPNQMAASPMRVKRLAARLVQQVLIGDPGGG